MNYLLLNRAFDRLAAIMETGTPAEQIKAARLTIDLVLRLRKIGEQAERRYRMATQDEVSCILLALPGSNDVQSCAKVA